MKNGITKRLILLLVVAFAMALLLSLSGNTSSTDLSKIPAGGEAGITSIPNQDVEIIPVTIVPESALRYAGDK